MTETVDDGAALEMEPESALKLPLAVKAGLEDERTFELALGSSVTAILDVFAAERGCRVDELIMFREGEDGPLSAIILMEAEYPHHRRHHVHHKGEVKLTVYYQEETRHRDFRRQATVEDVLAWAIEAFKKIDPSLATEFELALHGQKDELPTTEHVGHLAGHHHELALDLVRGDIANGSRT